MGPAISPIDDLRALSQAEEHAGQIIVTPNTSEELAAITRYANANKLAIEIAGAGTKRGWGNPVSAPIQIRTAGLAGMRHHSWQDLTATVGAGTPWAAMQRALAAHNQWVALDPLWPKQATVGGIVATNDSGAVRLRYGSLRDLIIGMTIVLADGTIARSGGKVVKNVAGYDLHKLMTGAYGTLGVIADVTFRLHPIAMHTAAFTVTSSTIEPLSELMLKILDSHLSVQAMQLRASAGQFALDLQAASLPQVLSEQSKRLLALTQSVSQSLAPREATRDCLEARQNLFLNADDVIVKATMPATAIATLSADVVRLGGTSVTQAIGTMFARFTAQAASDALPSLYAYVDAAGGCLTIMRAPVPLPPWAIPPRGAEKAPPLMREIKRRFDPNRTLNPGRFLGGI